MDVESNPPNKTNNILWSVLAGLGVAILSLLAGTIMDYMVVQIVSHFFLSGCSEDCYFAYFNSLFVIVALLSVVVGIRAGLRMYKRLSEKS
ncbi:MAG: hypothetical protein ABIQ77_08775 [Anaerolineales bacterium]